MTETDRRYKMIRHPVTKGQVHCMLRGELDIETCFYCPNLVAIDLDSPRPSMTCHVPLVTSEDERMAYERLSVLELAKSLGNVSQACRVKGVSRRQYYQYKSKFETAGLDGLRGPGRRTANMGPVTGDAVQKILDLSLAHPGWGHTRIKDTLVRQGTAVSLPTVQKVLTEHRLQSREARISEVERRADNGEMSLNREQTALVEMSNPCYRERKQVGEYPGQRLVQFGFFAGDFSRCGQVHVEAVIDTYSNYSFAMLCNRRMPLNAVMLLHYQVLPFFKERGWRVTRVITNTSKVYLGNERHPYPRYLQLETMEHLSEKHLNGYAQHFQQVLRSEFLRPVLKETPCNDLTAFQERFEQWLREYNSNRLNHGFPFVGKTPAQVLEDAAHNRISPLTSTN
ncbi:helix-turn-helix domain-containing protein [Alicyclobacillaceae bacterium I2511]|nr:helix-turn-helix domain-containing protein [Alicyclobacillaceae bacterium I2511]